MVTVVVDAIMPAVQSGGMDGIWQSLREFFATSGARATLIVLLGLPLTVVFARTLRRKIGDRYGAQSGLIAGKLAFYPLLILLTASVLRELGFSLMPLLGAAGILGIALGFASQTSVSNVISGFFLLGEQPFQVGDVIQIGDTTGRVLSVDMLSVKLRTFDNRFVRIPNETIIKSQITNNTRFPIRRVDIAVGIAYREDLERARETLLAVADEHPLSMMEPAPVVFVDGFGGSSVDLRLGVWTTADNFVEAKNKLLTAVKARLDAEGIEIPFPHVSLYAGTDTAPIPVRIEGSEDGSNAPVR